MSDGKIKGLPEKVKRKCGKWFGKLKYIFQTSYYISVLKKKSLDERAVFMESKSGEDLAGNIFYLLQELCSGQFSDFTVYLAGKASMRDSFVRMLLDYNITGVHFVRAGSKEYRRRLATAKYLFHDTAFPKWFIKREGQVYLNTCHEGLLTVTDGKTCNYIQDIVNIRNNLQAADYLLLSNTVQKETIMDRYALNNTWKGTVLIETFCLPEGCNHTAFCKEYGACDNSQAAKHILRHVLLGERCCREEKAEANGKPNVLVFCSNFEKNGITTSLFNMFRLVNHEKVNYYLAFPQEQFVKLQSHFNDFEAFAGLMPMNGNITEKTFAETLAFKLYFGLNIETKWMQKTLRGLFTREYNRRYGFIPIDRIIHFTGYAPYITMLYLYAPAKKAIFVHNDMYEEIKEKGNQHLKTLKHAYREYDRVAAVSQAVKNSLIKIEKNQDNVVIVENPHDDQGVLNAAKQEFFVDSETSINVEAKELKKLLLDKDKKKFITIGRFSKEKGHKKLIDAFARFAKNHPEAHLIIIGGYGVLYQETLEYAASMACADRIVIARALSNPFPILRGCDLFLLPSDREPLGLVLLEAATLRIPIVAANIPGSGDFMRRYGGYLVENSEEGLLFGMEAFMRGEVAPLEISFEDYNRDIVYNFEHLFD